MNSHEDLIRRLENLHERLCVEDRLTDATTVLEAADILRELVEERDDALHTLAQERKAAEKMEACLNENYEAVLRRAEKAEADLAAAREGLKDVLAHLVAAVSVLEHGGKRGVASDKMFKIMLSDYHKSIERGRAIAAARAEGGE